MGENVTHVFIVGSKGIPAGYGGFETFVQELVRRRKSDRICYHVACSIDETRIPESQTIHYYAGVQCFTVPMWSIGAARAVVYDLEALKFCAYYIQREKMENAIVYILACRVGPFIRHYTAILHRLGARVFINPDGHEWERAKWNRFIKKYWKFSERKMVQAADFVVCDSENIERYIRESYGSWNPRTCFIPYGADIPGNGKKEEEDRQRALEWLKTAGAGPGEYYLVVGRFVPENNYETMIREFMASRTGRKLLLITNLEKNDFYRSLAESTGFEKDSRICFPGTLYDSGALTQVRGMACAYLHGHAVGGTNPSLLEAMGSTNVNLLYDVGFNREVGGEGALYWNKEEGNLAGLIDSVDRMNTAQRRALGEKAKEIIRTRYTWESIVERYEELFLRPVCEQ